MTEDQLHRAVVSVLEVYRNRGLIEFSHPANGSNKSRAVAGQMKAFGQRAGIPDLLVWAAGRMWFIELKSAKGRLSERQKAWIDRMATYGFNTHVCRSVDDVLNALAHEGLPNIVRFA